MIEDQRSQVGTRAADPSSGVDDPPPDRDQETMQDLETIRVIARYVGPVCGDDEGKPGDSRDHPGGQSIGKDEVRVVDPMVPPLDQPDGAGNRQEDIGIICQA